MKKLISILSILLFAIFMYSCKGKKSYTLKIIPRDTTALFDGIDVSSHQKTIDWEKVSSNKNIKFAYIKATEGATYASPHYSYNLKMARQYGILVGSYHFFRSTSSLQDQFNNFTRTVPKESQDLIPMVDIETRGNWSREQLIDSLEAFMGMLQRHYGYSPMIYSTMAFYNANLSPYFNKYHLYIGRYSNLEPKINWNGRYTIWQFSERGMVDGIKKPVDLCKFSDIFWLTDIEIPTPI